MSDNTKYYYIKVKESYFNQDNVKIIESMENGYIYSLIILKLYVKSAKYNGHLMMTERIPYDPEKLNILANVLNHDVAHIKEALRLGQDLGLITVQESGDIWMTEIQNFIGHSSTEADRKRLYRSKIEPEDKCPTVVRQKSTRVRDRVKVKDIDKDIELKFTIDDSINYWNNKNDLPNFRYNTMTMKANNTREILNKFKVLSEEEIIQAIDNYSECYNDIESAYRNSSYETFMINSVDTWLNDGANYQKYNKKSKKLTPEQEAKLEKDAMEIWGINNEC